MRIAASSLLVIAGCSFVYLLTLGSTKGGYTRQKPVTYKFEEPTDWAKDSTVSYNKKNYCEYVYNQEEL
jgi:uncharacterized protein YceK